MGRILKQLMLGFLQDIIIFLCTVLMLLSLMEISSRSRVRKPVIKYPPHSEFFVTDFFVRGCRNFLDNCPRPYKYQLICAKSYNGDYRFFSNYCEMQYENCQTWNNWHIFKREKC